jgi:hypothetical protein
MDTILPWAALYHWHVRCNRFRGSDCKIKDQGEGTPAFLLGFQVYRHFPRTKENVKGPCITLRLAKGVIKRVLLAALRGRNDFSLLRPPACSVVCEKRRHKACGTREDWAQKATSSYTDMTKSAARINLHLPMSLASGSRRAGSHLIARCIRT